MNRTPLILALFLAGCSKSEPTTGGSPPGRATTPAVVPAGKGDPKPAPDLTATWTHKELANHLEQKGVKVKVDAAPLGDTAIRTAATFTIIDGEDKGSVAVWLYRTPEQAREGVGALGEHSFQFGRFAFGTSTVSQVPALLGMQKALR